MEIILVRATNLEPLVDALGVELVAARQHPERLPQLEITHADHAHGLVVLAAVAGISGKGVA